MAGEISHIALAAKIYHQRIRKPDIKAFFVGTAFPDIRYLRVIERDLTHTTSPTLKRVIEQSSSFLAGVEFHSVVDLVREDFMKRSEIYALCPLTDYTIQASKLLEDELYYRALSGWTEVVRYFDTVRAEEAEFKIPDSPILKWHKILQNYFAQRPTDTTREKFFRAVGFSESAIVSMNSSIKTMKESHEILRIEHTFYNHFEELLDKFEGKKI